MNTTRAEEIGLLALGWLVGNEELLPVFLGASGASISDLRDNAADPAMSAAILDFLLMDDAWIMGCCEALALPYDQLAQARAHLPGGDLPNWT